ncbi:hypothetical protein [Nocardia cyriacigeorgica]|uniref:Uncharacterized protein n=1 Tax=Nocardia cyriacigeorgica TaxID=135487 RepID=A0A5R8P0F3_9NOCA|nr:hypothetical protein [Nocardia cyriacigeorgica]TLF82573.1 hypothetical protein FEK34_02235 [Nocardia cyriacigeorgica]
MNIDTAYENFLLYSISDDWAQLGQFVEHARKFAPEQYTREYVLDLIRELVLRGYIEIGNISPESDPPWRPWDVPVDEAIQRIAHGRNGITGLLEMPEADLGPNELFRARLTALGRARLAELGDPYEKYGDPWFDDPYLNASDWGYPPYRPS